MQCCSWRNTVPDGNQLDYELSRQRSAYSALSLKVPEKKVWTIFFCLRLFSFLCTVFCIIRLWACVFLVNRCVKKSMLLCPGIPRLSHQRHLLCPARRQVQAQHSHHRYVGHIHIKYVKLGTQNLFRVTTSPHLFCSPISPPPPLIWAYNWQVVNLPSSPS